MPVALHMESEKCLCPQCDQRLLEAIEIIDKGYGARNGISPTAVADIAEDGVFTLIVCTGCGYKFCDNTGRATTSQIASLVITYYIDCIDDGDEDDLKDLIYDLNGVVDMSKRLSVEDVKDISLLKLKMIKAISDFVSVCPKDDLVEIYNMIVPKGKELEEAVSPTISQDADCTLHGMCDSVKSQEVIVDD
jgi:hypothetical protein